MEDVPKLSVATASAGGPSRAARSLGLSPAGPDAGVRDEVTNHEENRHGLHLFRRAARAQAARPRAGPLDHGRTRSNATPRTACRADALEVIAKSTLAAGLNAINMPAEWGGAGLSILDQVLVQEELGQLTNALWDAVWRPANALRACTPEQRERYLIPAIKGERRDCYAVTESEAGLGLHRHRVDGRARRGRLPAERGEVVRHRRRRRRLLHRHGQSASRARARRSFLVDKDSPGVVLLRTPRYMHHFVYKHPIFTFENVRVEPDQVLGGSRRRRRPHPRVVRRGASDDRRPVDGRVRASLERGDRLGQEPGSSSAIGSSRTSSSRPCWRTRPMEIATNRALVYQVASEADAGMDRKLVHAKAAMVKASASEAAGRVIDRAVQIFGGPRLHARVPRRAALPRHPGRPHLGGNLGDAAAHHRQRDRQARPRRPAGALGARRSDRGRRRARRPLRGRSSPSSATGRSPSSRSLARRN